MRIALASPPFPKSINDGIYWLDKLSESASSEGADIVCFPESFIPGYPGMGYLKEDRRDEALQSALKRACSIARKYVLAIILPMDWCLGNNIFNLAHVISDKGELLGYQTKNQLDPSEDEWWFPGEKRQLFEVNEIKFGITICHEGFRYPESVRWAAQRGAQVVFHPHFVGSNESGVSLTEWGAKANPYYEKAMLMRALENTIYFASVNYASNYPEAASAIVAPDGTCLANAAYGNIGVITADIDLSKATGLLAKRFKSDLFYK